MPKYDDTAQHRQKLRECTVYYKHRDVTNNRVHLVTPKGIKRYTSLYSTLTTDFEETMWQSVKPLFIGYIRNKKVMWNGDMRIFIVIGYCCVCWSMFINIFSVLHSLDIYVLQVNGSRVHWTNGYDFFDWKNMVQH